MAHTIHILLLVAALFTCPFRCLAEAQAGSFGEEKACACCDHEQENAPSSPLPAEDCGCPDCLCRGAIIEDSAGLLDAGQSVPDANCVTVNSAADVHLPAPRVEASSAPPPLMSAGRLLRVAIRSFQL
ncbi:MAG: hypothetical protein WD066_03570 [Planctomycetaceae bacterium]